MKTLKFGPAALLSLVFALCCAGQTVRAQDDDELYGEHLLPAKTLLMFSVPDAPALKQHGDSSMFGKLLADPEMQPFLQEVHEKIGELSGEISEKLGLTIDDLAKLPAGEITFAITSPKPGKLAGVFLFDYGENGEQVAKLIEAATAAAKENGCEHSTQEVAGVEVNLYKLPDNEHGNPIKHIAYFSHESYLGVATDVAALQQVLDLFEGNKKDSLATSESFSLISGKVAEGESDPVVVWYVDPIGLLQAGVSLAQAQAPQAGMMMGFLPILGVDKVKAFGGAGYMGIEEFDGVSKSFILVEQPTTGLVNVFQFPAVPQSPPKWVSADSVMYTGVNWDVAGAYTAIETLVDSFQGPGALERIIEEMADSEGGPQVNIKKDVVDQLSGQIHISSTVPKDAEAADQDFVVALGLTSEDKVKKLLAKASKTDGFDGEVRQFEGATIYEMPLPNVEKKLIVTVANGSLFIGTLPADIENVVRTRSGVASLVDSEVYKKLAKHIPEQVSILGYQKQDAQLRTAYDQLKSMDPEDLGGLDVSKLPEFEVLQKYLRASASYFVPDEDGALQVSFTLGE